MRRINERGVGQLHELVGDALVEHVGELVGRDADAGQKIRPADVADEQRVAGEHRLRLGAALRQVIHQDRDPLGRVARGLQHLELHVAELHHVAVLHGHAGELGLAAAPEVDRGPGPVTQLDVAGDEVGVEVREEHVPDGVAAGLGVGEILIDVPPGIDDGRRLRLLVRDHVGRVGQAGEIVLLDLHGDGLRGGCEEEGASRGGVQRPTAAGKPAFTSWGYPGLRGRTS